MKSFLRRAGGAIQRRLSCTSEDSPDPSETGPFSAAGEEAIVQELIQAIPDVPRRYVDIGAGDGITMSNTYRLALDGWQGLCLEWDGQRLAEMADRYQGLVDVALTRVRVTPQNICDVLKAHGVPQTFGVLSLDIDSYDHDVLDALLARFQPLIIVAEINEKAPPPAFFAAKYDDTHAFDGICFGQSIVALDAVARPSGYRIDRLEYNNAVLVHDSVRTGEGMTPADAYDAGYRNRDDRQARFPYNDVIDEVLDLAPEARAGGFAKYIKAVHEGFYELR